MRIPSAPRALNKYVPLDSDIELRRSIAGRTASRTQTSLLPRFQPSTAFGKLVEEA